MSVNARQVENESQVSECAPCEIWMLKKPNGAYFTENNALILGIAFSSLSDARKYLYSICHGELMPVRVK